MKKKISLLVITAILMSTGIFDKPIEINVNSRILSSFNNRFEGAKEVTWSKADQYIKTSFVKDQQSISAYIDITGGLTAIFGNIASQQLPVNLNNELRKHIAKRLDY